jgi:uncharacterized protein
MKFFITTKPHAREEKIENRSDNHFVVSVKEKPENGKANRAIINALAAYFDSAPSKIRILSGHTAKKKLIEIDGL